MPQRFDEKSSTAKTVEQARLEKIEKEIKIKREDDRKSRKAWKSLKPIKIEKLPTIIGDRTQNAKDLRKDARQKMRFDKDLSTNAYSVNETGKYWYEDVEMTLAVITHARMIIASRMERKHDAFDYRPTELRNVEHKNEGGENDE